VRFEQPDDFRRELGITSRLRVDPRSSLQVGHVERPVHQVGHARPQVWAHESSLVKNV
jgi:hypothetical protein